MKGILLSLLILLAACSSESTIESGVDNLAQLNPISDAETNSIDSLVRPSSTTSLPSSDEDTEDFNTQVASDESANNSQAEVGYESVNELTNITDNTRPSSLDLSAPELPIFSTSPSDLNIPASSFTGEIATDVLTDLVLYQYEETFDSWPDGGCRTFTRDRSPCNESFIHTFDQPQELMDVGAFPECRSGKCIRSVYFDNEDGRLFAPKSNAVPGTKEFYVRYYIKFGNDFAGGFPQSFKQVRLRSQEGRSYDMIIETIEKENTQHFVFQNVFGGVPDIAECTLEIDLLRYLNRWIKVEASIKMNSTGVDDGFCEIVVTPENGPVYNIKEQTQASTVTDTLRVFNHIQSNWTTGVGVTPAPSRTVFVDDVCVNGRVRERDNFCRE